MPQTINTNPTHTPTTLPVDDFHGVGGSYVMVDGVRQRVEGPALDGEQAAEQPAEQAADPADPA